MKKILSLLTPYQKKQAFILLVLIFLTAFIDTIGVASILPFVAVLANPQLVETNIFLNTLYQLSSNFGVLNVNQFLILLGVIFFLFLIFNLTIRAFSQYMQTRFSLISEYNIGMRLIEGYLHQPYIWYLKRNSSDLSKNILSEVNEIIYDTIVPTLNIIAQGILILFLLVLLLFIDITLALILGLIFGISYAALFYFLRKVLSRIGSERLKVNQDRFTSLSESFGSIKYIKTRGLEKNFIKQFSEPALIYANNQSLAQIINLLPRFFFEGLAFGGIILLILFLLARGEDFQAIIPIVALYTFVGYRLLPAFQQVYGSITQLRFSGSALDSLCEDLKNLVFDNSPKIGQISITKSISLRDVSFYYPNNKYPSLKNINLTIPALSKVGIVGATGSGKTTMIDIILGLLEPTEGMLCVDEKIINIQNKRSWQKNIGYVPQEIYLKDSSIALNIAFGLESESINLAALEQAAKIANLHDFIIKELPQQYDTIVGERGNKLSGGQRQRIGIARALYHSPQVIILDEATSALDNFTEKEVMRAIKNLDKDITIIIIAHRLSTVKSCDNIFLLDKGILKAQGTYEELLLRNKDFQKISGMF
jgi:ABC-type multidrug transport system fused ATPase/permease subunit